MLTGKNCPKCDNLSQNDNSISTFKAVKTFVKSFTSGFWNLL